MSIEHSELECFTRAKAIDVVVFRMGGNGQNHEENECSVSSTALNEQVSKPFIMVRNGTSYCR